MANLDGRLTSSGRNVCGVSQVVKARRGIRAQGIIFLTMLGVGVLGSVFAWSWFVWSMGSYNGRSLYTTLYTRFNAKPQMNNDLLLDNAFALQFNDISKIEKRFFEQWYSETDLSTIRPIKRTARGSCENGRKIIRVTIGRLIGNSMPPLQASDQIVRNVQLILQLGKDYPLKLLMSRTSTTARWKLDKLVGTRGIVADARHCHRTNPNKVVVEFSEFWFINRILNNTVWNSLASLLQERLVVEDPLLDNMLFGPLSFRPNSNSVVVNPMRVFEETLYGKLAWAGARNPLLYVTNQNAARNQILTESQHWGADWILPLDGNVVLLTPNMEAFARMLLESMDSNVNAATLPYYRPTGHSAQQIDQLATFNLSSSIDTLVRSEPQTVVKATSNHWFRERREYGKHNKDEFVRTLKKFSLCKDAFIGFAARHLTVATETDLVSRCGMSLRLPYWVPNEDILHTSSDRRQRARATAVTLMSEIIAANAGQVLWAVVGESIVEYSLPFLVGYMACLAAMIPLFMMVNARMKIT